MALNKPDNSHNHEFRSQTVFAQFEKIYRRPAVTDKMKKNSKNKEFSELMKKEEKILCQVIDPCTKLDKEIELKDNDLIDNSDNIYSFNKLDGLYIIPKYLSSQEQCDWIQYILSHVSTFPYNNLANLKDKCEKNNLWQSSIDTLNKKNEINEKTANISLNESGFRNLTWVNCGVKYDWTDRKYDLDNVTQKMPANMTKLCENICKLMNENKSLNKNKNQNKNKQDNDDDNGFAMIPQTSIVNYFQCNAKRPMGGHRDTAEKINVPLISVSLGNAAIFLISDSDETEPIKLFLRSGDVLIMSGKSRWAIHCVARVMPHTCPKELFECFDQQIEKLDEKDENYRSKKSELLLCKEYIRKSRLNFNMRQVVDNVQNEKS